MSSSKIHKCIGLVCQSHQNNQSTSGSVGKGRLVPMQRGRSPTQARVAHTKGDCTHDVCPVPAFFRPKKRANIPPHWHHVSLSIFLSFILSPNALFDQSACLKVLFCGAYFSLWVRVKLARAAAAGCSRRDRGFTKTLIYKHVPCSINPQSKCVCK